MREAGRVSQETGRYHPQRAMSTSDFRAASLHIFRNWKICFSAPNFAISIRKMDEMTLIYSLIQQLLTI